MYELLFIIVVVIFTLNNNRTNETKESGIKKEFSEEIRGWLYWSGICFDINWLEEWKSLKDQGAEIVFWPSAYPAGRLLPSYAWLFKYFVVGSSWRDPATIYDITGDLIASSGKYEPWIFARLNLEKVFLEITDYHEKLNEIKKKYGRKVHIRYYHDEDWVTIESLSSDLRIQEILDDYKLVPHWEYIKQEERLQKKYRNA